MSPALRAEFVVEIVILATSAGVGPLIKFRFKFKVKFRFKFKDLIPFKFRFKF